MIIHDGLSEEDQAKLTRAGFTLVRLLFDPNDSAFYIIQLKPAGVGVVDWQQKYRSFSYKEISNIINKYLENEYTIFIRTARGRFSKKRKYYPIHGK